MTIEKHSKQLSGYAMKMLVVTARKLWQTLHVFVRADKVDAF